MTDQIVSNPMIQWGFAGFAFTLLGIVVWLIRVLIGVLQENNRVIGRNTEVMAKANEQAAETFKLLIGIKDQLLQRPCLMEKK